MLFINENWCITALHCFRPRGPLTWLDPGAFGTLGVGGGFALGAKLCRPDAEVWIIYGDGSLGYSVAEFDTFTRRKVNWNTFCSFLNSVFPLYSSIVLRWSPFFLADVPRIRPDILKCTMGQEFFAESWVVKRPMNIAYSTWAFGKKGKESTLSGCDKVWEKPTMGHNQEKVPFCFFFRHF